MLWFALLEIQLFDLIESKCSLFLTKINDLCMICTF